MTHKILESYLRTYRKNFGFSQKEIAFLLNCQCGSKISRYENGKRIPNLLTAFSYEVIFNVPLAEIFAGVYKRVEQRTNKRMQILVREMDAGDLSVSNVEKLNLLRRAFIN
jgi:transcriptional regulator with XRE-family HTH domain